MLRARFITSIKIGEMTKRPITLGTCGVSI